MSVPHSSTIDTNQLILVDEHDNVLGQDEKVACHLGDGQLHRAFSIIIFDGQQRLLLQCRAEQKMLWPGFWSNSCCSHPAVGETMQQATELRLQQELGIACELTFLYQFKYQAKFEQVGAEHELCSVFVGQTDATPAVNPNEIRAIKYISVDDLDNDLVDNIDIYTPWFKLEWQTLRQQYWPKIDALFK